LLECVVNSECFKATGNVKECLKDATREDVPDRCKNLRIGYFECRRGMLDMRNRFRGNKGY